MYRESLEHRLRLDSADAGALHVDPADGFHWAGALDEPPFLRSTWHVIEQSSTDRIQVRAPAAHDDDRKSSAFVQGIDVDNVEAGERDTLQQDCLQMLAEARAAYERQQYPGRVGAVASDSAAEYAFQPCAGVYRTDDEHVTPVLWFERRVVEADRVR
jgi:hypothetical protein